MDKQNRKNTINALWMLGLTILAVLTMHKLLQHTLPNLAGTDRFFSVMLLPATMLVFHVLAVLSAANGLRRRAIQLDQWCFAWLIPFFLVGLLAESPVILKRSMAVIVLIFSVVRIIFFAVHRQTKNAPKPLLFLDIVAVIAVQFIFIAITMLGVENIAITTALTGIAINTIIGFLAVHAISRFAGSNHLNGSLWQRLLLVGAVLSLPVIQNLTAFTWETIPALGVLLVFALKDDSRKYAQILFVMGAGVVTFISPIINPGLAIMSLWMLVTIMLHQSKLTDKDSRFLWIGGFSVLFLAGVFVSFINVQGSFPQSVIYPFPGPLAVVGALVSRGNGLLLVAPIYFMAIVGWLLAFRQPGRVNRALWFGWPAALFGVVSASWIETGMLPKLHHWIVPVVCLIPFIGCLWPMGCRFFQSALLRVSLIMSLGLSGLIWIMNICYARFGYSMAPVLEHISNQSGLDLVNIFPQISHKMPVFTQLFYLDLLVLAAFLGLLLLARLVKGRDRLGLPDAFIVCVLLLASAGIIHAARIWYRIPLSGEVELQPGQRWSTTLDLDKKIVALEIESRMGCSTHLADGVKVLQITIDSSSGFTETLGMYAGIDTAEWAYDRGDVLRIVQHSRPMIAKSWTVLEENGNQFQGHTYRSHLFLPTELSAQSIIIENLVDDGSMATATISDIRILSDSNQNSIIEPVQLLKTDLKLYQGELTWEHQFDLPQQSRGIFLDSFLENAAMVPQGEIVAHVLATGFDGVQKLWLIRAGVNTAEWAISRPDMIGHIQHSVASVGKSDRRLYNEEQYLAHSYRSAKKWDQLLELQRLEVKLLLDETKYPRCKWIVSGITVY